MELKRGTVVLIDLNPTQGHEQRGVRPGVVISDPDVSDNQRFPLLCLIPITGTPGKGALYPPLAPGPSGLLKASFALIDQLRSVDKRRVLKVYGRVREVELRSIDAGLRLYLGLSTTP